MRTSPRRPIVTALVLVGAMSLLAGCGDDGAHMPAGMDIASARVGASSVFGGDPGSIETSLPSVEQDPVLAGADELLDGFGGDDPYARAASDWNEREGSLGGLASLDGDDWQDDGPMPVGYGRSQYGYGDELGLGLGGSGVLGATALDGGWGGAGVMDAGLMDAGLDDPGLMDAGFDGALMDAGFDPGFDAGAMDAGFDPGLDAGAMDVGLDAGFVDTGIDPGMMDAGFDAGMDPGFIDAGLGF